LDPHSTASTNPRQLGGTSGIGGDTVPYREVAKMSIPGGYVTPTLIDPVDLDILTKEFGVVFIPVPFAELDDCSECPESALVTPAPSTLLIVYKRHGWIYREPVCGVFCAAQKLRALLGNVTRPDFIHVHVLEQRRGVAA
jgi:hypothetical protein